MLLSNCRLDDWGCSDRDRGCWRIPLRHSGCLRDGELREYSEVRFTMRYRYRMNGGAVGWSGIGWSGLGRVLS